MVTEKHSYFPFTIGRIEIDVLSLKESNKDII